MKVRKISAMFCAVMIMLSLLIPASAAESDSRIDLGDGFYIVRAVTSYAMARSGDMIYGKVTDKLYYETTQIGSATLFASFDISGTSAVAKGAYLQGTGMNGFTYESGGTYCGGNRATGVAMFVSSTVFKQLPLSISCTPDGELY